MYSSAFKAMGQRAAVTIRKISVKAESTSERAISLGVRWRTAPSTSAIIRSRKDLPAWAVISPRIRAARPGGPAGAPGAPPPAPGDPGSRPAGEARFTQETPASDPPPAPGDDLPRLAHAPVSRLQRSGHRFLDPT